MVKTVYIIIGCDVDPDRKNFISDLPEEILSWVGLREGIPRAKDLSENIKDSEGNSPVFTWCLRADDQIRHYYGDYAGVLREHRDLLNELSNSGDELAWHPHFWRWDSKSERWFQETEDHPWQREMLENSFAAYRRIFPDAPQSVRMGWNYHNSDTMAKLDALGIKVDFSAVPGLKLQKTGARHDNIYDWYRCPRLPYNPSRNNYLLPAGGEDALAIIEIPNLVSRSFVWGIIAGLVLANKMKDIKPIIRSLIKPRYFINITAAGRLYTPILTQFRKDLINHRDENYFLNCYFHSDEMARNINDKYAADFFEKNLRSILEVVKTNGAASKFITASMAAKII